VKHLTLLVALAFALVTWTQRASAHVRSISYSSWQIDGSSASVVARLSLLDQSLLERAGVSRAALPGHLRQSLTLAGCEPGSVRERAAEPEWLDFEWSLSCPAGAELALESTLLVALNPTHLHLARVSIASGAATELVLDAATRRVALDARRPEPASFLRFVQLGVEHIATGWDHLLFVLMLLFAAGTLRRAAWVVTGFTLGHSVTLSLSVLGVLVPREGPIEALIALSIALLAVENAWLEEGRRRALLPIAAVGAVLLATAFAFARSAPVAPALIGVALFAGCYFALVGRGERPEVARAAVAGLFGLVHGFGFARVLSEMQLEPARLARALVGFNLGVEAGQILAIALAWPMLLVLRRAIQGRTLVSIASAGALLVACYWFVVRAFEG